MGGTGGTVDGRRTRGERTRAAIIDEIEAYGAVINTEDRMEGIRAFNEKRKPVFKGV